MAEHSGSRHGMNLFVYSTFCYTVPNRIESSRSIRDAGSWEKCEHFQHYFQLSCIASSNLPHRMRLRVRATLGMSTLWTHYSPISTIYNFLHSSRQVSRSSLHKDVKITGLELAIHLDRTIPQLGHRHHRWVSLMNSAWQGFWIPSTMKIQMSLISQEVRTWQPSALTWILQSGSWWIVRDKARKSWLGNADLSGLLSPALSRNQARDPCSQTSDYRNATPSTTSMAWKRRYQASPTRPSSGSSTPKRETSNRNTPPRNCKHRKSTYAGRCGD